MCRFKFRLWNCLSYPQDSETAGLHKVIKLSGYSDTLWPLFVLLYFNCHLSSPTFPKPHYPSKIANTLASPWKRGGGLTARHKLFLCCVLLAIYLSFFIYQTFLPSRRRDCFPTPPSMRFSALSLSLFVGEWACPSRCINVCNFLNVLKLSSIKSKL